MLSADRNEDGTVTIRCCYGDVTFEVRAPKVDALALWRQLSRALAEEPLPVPWSPTPVD